MNVRERKRKKNVFRKLPVDFRVGFPAEIWARLPPCSFTLNGW